ncbi:MAG: biopolymer transporter ExbD [Candidatus Symbiothrix sp.]|jgi:biopolymer transport protein ExbD|nr:biopolymer transporter ExbD [Candidatus Symbiothrix sp.]
MNRFRRNKNQVSMEINTASLPDLIFTILFFFMITTHLQPVFNKMKVDVPTATELQKLQEKSLIVYIMVGKTDDTRALHATSLQLNNEIILLEELPEKLKTVKSGITEEDQSKLTTVLKVDKTIPMGLVNDIKAHLREAGILTIHYAAKK